MTNGIDQQGRTEKKQQTQAHTPRVLEQASMIKHTE